MLITFSISAHYLGAGLCGLPCFSDSSLAEGIWRGHDESHELLGKGPPLFRQGSVSLWRPMGPALSSESSSGLALLSFQLPELSLLSPDAIQTSFPLNMQGEGEGSACPLTFLACPFPQPWEMLPTALFASRIGDAKTEQALGKSSEHQGKKTRALKC